MGRKKNKGGSKAEGASKSASTPETKTEPVKATSDAPMSGAVDEGNFSDLMSGAWGADKAGFWAYDDSESDDEAFEVLKEEGLEGLSRTESRKQAEDELRSLFDSMDTDNNGFINRQDVLEALKTNPHVREFLGLPAEIEKGSEWHAAFEAVFQAKSSTLTLMDMNALSPNLGLA